MEDDFGYRIEVLITKFPKKPIPEDTVVLTEKGGKYADREKVSVTLLHGNLYLKDFGKYRGITDRCIPNATSYLACEITCRLDLGIGWSTEAVRLASSAIFALFNKKGLPIQNPNILRTL